MTLVERSTSCIVGWQVAAVWDAATWQAVLDAAPQARVYFRDASPIYAALIYAPVSHSALPNKSQTYRVEGDNAELRHYLARLARRSRCFSRSLKALRCALKMFVTAWNPRQLYRKRHPNYQPPLFDFISPEV